jgi:hypothetical protein
LPPRSLHHSLFRRINMEPSQLFNKVLGRNSETGGVEFWRQPERAGWLMKQGDLQGTVTTLPWLPLR